MAGFGFGFGLSRGGRAVPNFGFAGRSAAFINALNEAAATGLALDFQTPQYWLRGARQGNFASGVSGATYTRTGSRAGLDAAVVYAANVPRVAPSSGLRVFGSGTNLVFASEDLTQASWVKQAGTTVTANQAIAPNGSLTADLVQSNGTNGVLANSAAVSTTIANSKSIWLRGVSGGESVSLRDGQLTLGTVTCNLTTSWQRFSLSEVQTGEFAQIWVAGIPAGGIYIWGGQLENNPFASDYIPNPNTGASSSAGADVPLVSYATGTEFTAIVQWVEPPAIAAATRLLGVTLGTDPSVLEINSPTTLGSWNGAIFINGTTATRAAGSVQRAVFRQTGAGRQIHYNGAQIISDANPLAAISQLSLGCTSAGGGSLNSGLHVTAIIPRDIGATQANAVSVL